MFTKLFNLSEKTTGLIPKIEKVARFISFLVLALDTLRFFKSGLEKLDNNGKENEEAPAGRPAAGSGPAPIADEFKGTE